MLHLREWLTINEACQFLSEKLDKSVNPDVLYRWVLDGHLQLSLYLQSPVKARSVKIVQKPIKLIFSRLDVYLEENRTDFLRSSAPATDEYDYAECQDENFFAVEGIYPLSMHGEERFLLGCMYSRYSNQPLPRRPTTRPSGIILDMGEGKLAQLLSYLNPHSEIASLMLEVENGLFPERIASHVIPALEAIQAIKSDSPDNRRRFTPQNSFPSDAYLVIRIENLNVFVEKLVSAEKQVKAQASAEPSDLLKNTLRFVIKLHYGEEAVQNIRRYVDQKNSPMHRDFDNAGERLPSGMTMAKWIGENR